MVQGIPELCQKKEKSETHWFMLNKRVKRTLTCSCFKYVSVILTIIFLWQDINKKQLISQNSKSVQLSSKHDYAAPGHLTSPGSHHEGQVCSFFPPSSSSSFSLSFFFIFFFPIIILTFLKSRVAKSTGTHKTNENQGGDNPGGGGGTRLWLERRCATRTSGP